VLGGHGSVLYVSTTLDSFDFRAKTLIHSSVASRVRKWQSGGEKGEATYLSSILSRAAYARSYGGGLDAAFTEQVLREDLPRAILEEVMGAGKSLRFAYALDWPRLQRLLHQLEKALVNCRKQIPGNHPLDPQHTFLCSLRLLVLDCLPTVIYPVLGGKGNHVGHAALTEIGSILHRLAKNQNLAVIVLNGTVGEKVEDTGSTVTGSAPAVSGTQITANTSFPSPSSLHLRPALGLTWSFVPDVSILVTRQSQKTAVDGTLRDALLFSVLKSSRTHLGSISSNTAAEDGLIATPPITSASHCSALDFVPETLEW